MSEPLLPRRVDLRKLVARQGRMSGNVALGQLERIRALAPASTGAVEVELSGRVEDDGYRVVTGRLRTQLTLQCQRCLGPVSVTLDERFAWGLVWSDAEAEQVPRRYDPMLVDDSEADLWDSVAEELLLALPIVALHDDDTCGPAGPEGGEPDGEPGTAKDNPFAVLEKLKR